MRQRLSGRPASTGGRARRRPAISGDVQAACALMIKSSDGSRYTHISAASLSGSPSVESSQSTTARTLRRVVGVQDGVVDAVVAVHDRRAALLRNRLLQTRNAAAATSASRSSSGRRTSSHCEPQRAHLAFQISAGLAEVAESDGGRVDGVQVGQHPDQRVDAAVDDALVAERLEFGAAAHHLPGNVFDHLERRAEHRVVVAQRDRAGHRNRRCRPAPRPPCTRAPCRAPTASAHAAAGGAAPTSTRRRRPGTSGWSGRRRSAAPSAPRRGRRRPNADTRPARPGRARQAAKKSPDLSITDCFTVDSAAAGPIRVRCR